MSTRQKELKINDRDEVTEASLQSFPASDPPAFNLMGSRRRSRRRDDGGEAAGTPRAAEAEGERQGGVGPVSGPTTVELRESMPSGRSMGISSAAEPAAASFDTDDEAAGTSPSPEAVRAAQEHEAVLFGSRERADQGRQLSVMSLAMALVALAALIGVIALVWILFI